MKREINEALDRLRSLIDDLQDEVNLGDVSCNDYVVRLAAVRTILLNVVENVSSENNVDDLIPAQIKTLRDEFAMSALNGIIGSGRLNLNELNYITSDYFILTYKIADAMLLARLQKGEQK